LRLIYKLVYTCIYRQTRIEKVLIYISREREREGGRLYIDS